jgi:hypothetical protein
MISFWEKKLHFSPKSYNILLSRLLVNGKEVTPGDETGILEQSICHTPEIKLRANQSMFSIEYATSNFIPANRDEILYRLEGFSDEWNHTYRKQTLITYTNLNPGKYTLVIKSQRDGIKEAKLLIIVLPSWYETWWAYLIYTIVTISLLWYLIQNYNSRIKLREVRKEAYRRPGSTEPVETPLLYEYLARVPYAVDTNRRTGGDVVAGTDVHTQYI